MNRINDENKRIIKTNRLGLTELITKTKLNTQ